MKLCTHTRHSSADGGNKGEKKERFLRDRGLHVLLYMWVQFIELPYIHGIPFQLVSVSVNFRCSRPTIHCVAYG